MAERKDDLQRLGTVIRRYRQARGMTIGELAAESGLSRRFVAGVEAGEMNIAVGRLIAIAQALDLTLAALTAEAEL